MPKTIRPLFAACAAVLMLMAGVATAAPVQPATGGFGYHAGNDGHLPPLQKNVEQVGRVQLTTIPWGIGDVTALGDWAYLAAYAPECFNQGGPGGGVHIVNLAIPQLPLRSGFISAGENTYVGEGLHAFSMRSKHFTGDVLLMSHEPCDYREKANGGISLYDITDPTAPEPLAIGVGDTKPKSRYTAHSSHSAQAWTVGKRAYVALVDNEDSGRGDIDILNITNPRKPKLIAETGLAKWPDANGRQSAQLGSFPSSFHHDMWVRKINGHWYLLASYWDTGWVVLNVDNPAKPRFLRDSNFPKRDAITGTAPEGNAHQAVWSNNGKYILGATEDLFAKYSYLTFGAGKNRQYLPSVEVPGALSMGDPVGAVQGPTVYGGTGCPPFSVPAASQTFGNLSGGSRPIVVLQEGGGCSIRDKLQAADVAGYYLAIIATSHTSTLFGNEPNRLSCPAVEGARPSIYGFCISHENFHELMKNDLSYIDPGLNEPKVGDRGRAVAGFSFFDGSWGNVRLLNAKTMKELHAFAIPESRSADYGTGFGTLSVHEIKMDPRRNRELAYVSWYSGGLRVFDVSKGRFKQRGVFIGNDGNNFWGVFPHRLGGDPQPYVLMSDVSYGLYVLRYTGPGA